MYVTIHALQNTRNRVAPWSSERLRDEAMTSLIFGKRKDNAFTYNGVTFCFNRHLTTLKTVYKEE